MLLNLIQKKTNENIILTKINSDFISDKIKQENYQHIYY